MNKGMSYLFRHRLRGGKPLRTQSPTKPFSILVLIASFTKYVHGVGLYRQAHCDWGAARQQAQHGWGLIWAPLGAVNYSKTQLAPGPVRMLINTILREL